jgi:hypothetical protein
LRIFALSCLQVGKLPEAHHIFVLLVHPEQCILLLVGELLPPAICAHYHLDQAHLYCFRVEILAVLQLDIGSCVDGIPGILAVDSGGIFRLQNILDESLQRLLLALPVFQIVPHTCKMFLGPKM